MDESLRKKNTKKNVTNSKNSGVVRNRYGTGVRSYLVNSGLNNSDIDYDQKNNKVTYKGKPVISPNIVVDGTSYADEESLRNLALNIHNEEGTDLVSAGDYATARTGIKNAVSIDDGYVAIGDSVIKANVTSDGVAYVPRSDMEKATAEYILSTGYKSERDIFDAWKSDYGAKLENAINSLIGAEWSYNPEEDPAYRAYAELYQREGQRAFRDAYGNALANTGGNLNSAALTQGAQSMGYYMQKLADVIPELMQDDYERFYKNRQNRADAVGKLMELGEKAYEFESEANNSYLERINQANDANYVRIKESDAAEIDEKLKESQIFNNYIDAEKGLVDLEYMPGEYESKISNELVEAWYKPKLYESELKNEELERAIDEIDILYKPKLYEGEIAENALKQALDSIEAEFAWDLSAAELEKARQDILLKELQRKYFLWK